MRDLVAALVVVIFALSASYGGDRALTPAATSATASNAAADAAAARHAKRIACRKEATDQKLTGDEKLDYIKDCIKKPARS